MPQNHSPESPLQPLSVGNVVSSGLVLYRSHLKSYLGVAFRATLWTLLPSFIQLVIPQIPVQINQSLAGLIALVLLAIYIYCFAKASANSALISRLAFRQLINQPETVNSARGYVNSRMWKFLWATILTTFILITSFVGLYILWFFLVLLIAGLTSILGRALAAYSNIFTLILYLVLAIVQIGLLVGFLTGILWFISRFFITDLPLAIENGVGIRKTIGRSWDLTNGSAFRIILILSVASLLTTPFVAVSLIPIWFILPNFRLNPTVESLNSIADVINLISALFIITNMFVLPFWQCVKAVIYYDLRSRKEGLDLQLRDRSWEM